MKDWHDARAGADRLGFGAIVATALHLGLILGVGFSAAPRDPPAAGLEVTLAQFRSDRPVEDARFIAQADQLGSGEADRDVDPRAPRAAVFDGPRVQESPVEPSAGAARPADAQLLRAEDSAEAAPAADEAAAEQGEQGPARESLPAHAPREIDSLIARLDEQARAYATRPRVHRLTSVSARAAEDAAYLVAWTERVESIGNRNYPVEARRRRLYGDLRLLVAVRADGSVAEVRVLQSSGYRLLDDAAVRIVRLSAPFEPFPPELRARSDVLEIIRTWQFRSDRVSASG